MSATPEHGGLSDEDAACVEAALRAVDAYDADPTGAQIGHWPTVAGWLMVEVRRLRALLDDPAAAGRATCPCVPVPAEPGVHYGGVSPDPDCPTHGSRRKP